MSFSAWDAASSVPVLQYLMDSLVQIRSLCNFPAWGPAAGRLSSRVVGRISCRETTMPSELSVLVCDPRLHPVEQALGNWANPYTLKP